MFATTTSPTAPATHALAGPPTSRSWADTSAPTAEPVTADDVCRLISAAGPLTLCDIAGGLDVPFRRAAVRVRRMVAACELRRDEFGRYATRGACATC
jgi:hypothetical protein